ncbi:hypothetical protein [Tenacibaculum geojense]|uniref:Lipoprotein n=1 Tax=Tenacibaculum geojense TaxID=915352 RepID=A0ABW3JMX7_9FLAO
MKTNKLRKLLKFGLVLFGLSLMLWNCEKEENQLNSSINNSNFISTAAINEVQQFLDDTNYSSKRTSNSFNLITDFDKLSYDKIENSNELLAVVPANIEGKKMYSRILITKVNNSVSGVLFSMTQNYGNSESNFTGKAYISDLQGNFINGLVYENGIPVKKLQLKENTSGRSSNGGDCPDDCPYIDCTLCQLDEVVITAPRPTEGPYAIVPFIYVYDYHQENEELLGDFAWDSNGGGGSNSGSGTSCTGDKVYNSATNTCNCPSGTVENTRGECIEDILNETGSPCVGDIIDALHEKDLNGALVPDLQGKEHLSQIVLDLFGKCSNYDLIVNVAELGTGPHGGPVNGKTNGISSITLDDDLIDDATRLSIAKVLIHESLHLYMNWIMRKAPDSDMTIDVKAYFYEYNEDSNLSHHQYMQDFVEALAYSLSAYDNHRLPMDYYKAMSWGGLESSDTYQGFDQDKKDAIQEIINNERHDRNGAQSTQCE